MNLSNIVEVTWPVIGVLLGLTATGVSVYLAATGHEIAMTAVGTSNFSMVLALCGTSLVIISALGWYETIVRSVQNRDGLPMSWPAVFVLWFGAAVGAVVLGGLGYGVVHHVIGNLAIADSLSVSSSLITQAIIGLALGAGIGFVFASMLRTTTSETAVFIATMALICAGATALGPTLSVCMGAAATDAASSLSMEITLAAGLGLLALVPFAVLTALKQEDDADFYNRYWSLS